VTVGASRTLDVSAGTLTLAADQISGDKVEGGTINAITVNTLTLGTTLTGADKPFTGLGDFTFTDGSIIATATSDSATVIFKATDDDGAALAQLEVMRLVGANDPYVAFGGSQQFKFYNGGTATFGAITLAGAVSGGAQTISNANVTVGASRTLDVSAGTLTLADNQISGNKVEGGTIAAITITALTAETITASSTVTCNGNLVTGTMDIDDDSGAVTLVDMDVTDAPADGTEESIILKLDGVAMFTLYGKADSAGAVDERSLVCGTYLQLLSTDTDGIATGQLWYDTSENKLKFKTAAGVETITSGA
jgi:hypothetical protein